MAARRPTRKTPDRPPPPVLTIPLADAQRLIIEQLERGREIAQREITDRSALAEGKARYSTWVDYNRDLLRRILSTDEPSDEFAHSIHFLYVARDTTLGEDIEEFRSDVGIHVRRLTSLHERLPLFAPDLGPSAAERTEPEVDMRRVFVVHGHNLATLDRVVRLLRDLELEPVVLREQPSQGRTIIEKFEAHTDVAFAVVILTADDIPSAESSNEPGGPALSSTSERCPRARLLHRATWQKVRRVSRGAGRRDPERHRWRALRPA